MTTTPETRERTMGEVRVTLALANFADEENCRRGLLPPPQVRRATVEALVDTGSTRLVLPSSVVQMLGLAVLGRIPVRFADDRRDVRDRVGIVSLELMGRKTEVDAVVEPGKSYALLGQIPLEGLDLRVDCAGRRLIPNPESPDAPLSEMQ
ncbi:MAG: aspartyl protease family protein [Planctomycetes bacterium]|nr:aspartyl protease family protein [Planctomycetota bacterium]